MAAPATAARPAPTAELTSVRLASLLGVPVDWAPAEPDALDCDALPEAAAEDDAEVVSFLHVTFDGTE